MKPSSRKRENMNLINNIEPKIFTRIYKKNTLYVLIFVSTTMGIISALLEFIYGDFFYSVLLLLSPISWDIFIYFPLIRNITRREKLIKKPSFTKNITLNKRAVLVERIISLLIIILSILGLSKAMISSKPVYYIAKVLYFLIIGISHYSLILITRLISEPKYKAT